MNNRIAAEEIPDVGASDSPAVIVTKHVGLEGAALIAHAKAEELSAHFNPDMVRAAKLFIKDADVSEELRIANEAPSLVYKLSEGGLFAALWDITERTKTGAEIDLRAVPIRQETVEICEFYDLNPYELHSGGSLLIVTMHDRKICGALKKAGIDASVIGSLNHGNDRVLMHNGVRSFLNRPSAKRLSEILDII